MGSTVEKRCASAEKTTSPSRRASHEPMQWWMPKPKARWRLFDLAMSNFRGIATAGCTVACYNANAVIMSKVISSVRVGTVVG